MINDNRLRQKSRLLCVFDTREADAGSKQDRKFIKILFSLVTNLLILFILMRCTKLYKKIYKDCRDFLKQHALVRQLQTYRKQLALMEESQESIRSLRHDMKHHLIFLRSCLKNEDISSAVDYIDEIEQCIEASENFIHSGNHAVDSILNYHLSHAAQLGCKLSTKIMVSPALKISDFDLNILLGNLLENALDALQRTSQRTLDIYIHYEINILYISIYNSFDGIYQKKNGKYLSTKKDKKHHGYGLQNVQSILDKYNGISRFTVKEYSFGVDVILNI